MIKAAIATLVLCHCFLMSDNNVYDFTIHTMSGDNYSLTRSQGKRILVFILPTEQSVANTRLLVRADSMARAHTAELTIIAVPSFEYGYPASLNNALQQWYQSSLGGSIILSKPLYTHKVSGSQQDPLFNWLTHAEKNIHFDEEVRSGGCVFFINKQGKLHGVFGLEGGISDFLVNLMFQQNN